MTGGTVTEEVASAMWATLYDSLCVYVGA